MRWRASSPNATADATATLNGPASCAKQNTVIAAPLPPDALPILLPLAKSAVAFGFKCVVVQPFETILARSIRAFCRYRRHQGRCCRVRDGAIKRPPNTKSAASNFIACYCGERCSIAA